MSDLIKRYPALSAQIEAARSKGIPDKNIESFIQEEFGEFIQPPVSDEAVKTQQREPTDFLSALSQSAFGQEPGLISKVPIVGKPLEVLLQILEVPQAIATAGIGALTDTGRDPEEGFLSRLARSQDPSELVGAEGLVGLGVDILADPLNLLSGAGFLKALKLTKAERAAEAISKTEDLTPLARLTEEATQAGAEITGKGKAPETGIEKSINQVEPGLFRDRKKRMELAEEREIQLNTDDYTKAIPHSPEIAKAAQEEFKKLALEGKIEYLDPKTSGRPLSVQISEQVLAGNITLKEIVDKLTKTGMSVPEAVAFAAGKTIDDQLSVSLAARKVALQRTANRNFEKLLKFEKDKEIKDALKNIISETDKIENESYFRKFYDHTTNLWRASLVAQLGTAVRNAVTGVGNISLDVMQSALEVGIQKIPGIKQTSSFADAFEPVMRLFSKNKELTNKLLEMFPKKHTDNLLNTVSADVVAKGKGAKWLDAYTRSINFFNLFQERVLRRAIFQSEVHKFARKQGVSVDDLVKNDKLGLLDKFDIEGAIEKSLDITFASAPKSKLALSFVDFVNRLPGGLLILPFPRFLANSIKFFYEFSPTGMVKLFSPTGKEYKRILSGDTKNLAKSIMGTAMLGTAWEISNSEFAGEKWYEIKAGGKTFDIRPFGPFSGYMFVADLVKRNKEGRLSTLQARDIASGVLGANVKAGTGLFIVDSLLEGMAGLRDTKKFKEKGAQFAGEFLGGFLSPIQTITDLLDQFDESKAVVRQTRSGDPLSDLLGPAQARIPFLKERLPEAKLPTREGPLRRVDPFLRQFPGVTIRDKKNPAEIELDRLGFSRQEIAPSTGSARANNLIAKNLGRLVERVVSPFVQSPGYKEMSEAQKGFFVKRMLDQLRGFARRMAIGEDPKLFRELAKRSRREQRFFEEILGEESF